MELLDSNVRQEFIEGVAQLLELENIYVDKTVLDRFVLILSDTRTPFPVSVSEISHLFSIDVVTIKRLIDPALARSGRTTNERFIENRDFIYIERKNQGPRHIREMFLTLSTFGKLVFRLQSQNARLLQRYYLIVEKLYREWAGNAISEKQKVMREQKIPPTPKIDLHSLPSPEAAYLFRITQNDTSWLKPGHSGYVPGRVTNLQYQYPGIYKLLQSKEMRHPSAQEECFKGLVEEHKIVCTKAPCPTEIFFDDFDPELAWSTCAKGQDDILKNYKQALLERNIKISHKPRPPEGMQGFIFRTRKGNRFWKQL